MECRDFIALLPDSLVGPEGACRSPAFELILPELQHLLSGSLDLLLHEKMRKRAAELMDWRFSGELAFEGATTRQEQTAKIVDFFTTFGLPVLYEDLARRMNRSLGKDLGLPMDRKESKALLKLKSQEEITAFLVDRGVATRAVPFDIDLSVVSPDGIARSLFEASCGDGESWIPVYFMISYLIRFAQGLAGRLHAERPLLVDENIVPYLGRAIRREGLGIFNRIVSTGSRLYGRVYSRVVPESCGAVPRSGGRKRGCESWEDLAVWAREIVDKARQRKALGST